MQNNFALENNFCSSSNNYVLGQRLSLSDQHLWNSLDPSLDFGRRRASSQNRPPRRGDVVSPSPQYTPSEAPSDPSPLYISCEPRSRKPILYSSQPSVHASAPSVHSSAPSVHASAPSVHASAPSVHVDQTNKHTRYIYIQICT